MIRSHNRFLELVKTNRLVQMAEQAMVRFLGLDLEAFGTFEITAGEYETFPPITYVKLVFAQDSAHFKALTVTVEAGVNESLDSVDQLELRALSFTGWAHVPGIELLSTLAEHSGATFEKPVQEDGATEWEVSLVLDRLQINPRGLL